jgi:hypothetical protein
VAVPFSRSVSLRTIYPLAYARGILGVGVNKMAENARKQLLDFLDQNVFDPVLGLEEEYFVGRDKEKFREAKAETMREKEKYHNYETAHEIAWQFEKDVTSGASRKINEELDELGLPKLEDFREEFFELSEDLGAENASA